MKDIINRNTKQKEIILNFLKNNQNIHFTASEILKSLDKKISKATVYRELTRLVDEGKLKKYVTDEHTCACYQYVENGEKCFNHYHLICDKCEKLIHFDNDVLNSISSKVMKDNHFKIDTGKIVFHGLCEECIKEKKK